MGYRQKDTRPRVALWMLVALGDAVLLLASVGLPVLVALLTTVTVTAAGVASWRLSHRGTPVRTDPATASVSTRRRA